MRLTNQDRGKELVQMAKVHPQKGATPVTKPKFKTRKTKKKSPNGIKQLIIRNKPLLLLTLAVMAIVLFVYWPSIQSQALSIDDQQYLVSNRLVQNPGWISAGRFFGEILKPSTVPGYYQPLSMISLMVDYAMGGRINHLQTFHLTSLILHILNTGLIIILLYLLFRNYWVAALAGLLFGIHPITVEAIPWIGERKTLLAAFFALGSLVFYLRHVQQKSCEAGEKVKKFYWFSLGAYFLALLAKPTSIPLPFVMMLLDYWPLKKFNRKSFIEKFPFFGFAVISAIVTYFSQKYTAGVILPGNSHPGNIFLIICYNIFFYVSKFFWPHNMSSFNPFPNPLTITNPAILASVTVTVALIILLLISLRRTKAFLFGGVSFVVAIFPVMGIIGFTNVIVSDKYAYLPSIAILITLAWLLNVFQGKIAAFKFARGRAHVIIIAIVAILGVAEGFMTRNCLAYWKDSETLFRHMLESAPQSPMLHDHLGFLLLEKGDSNEAISHFKEALRLDPEFYKTYNNLGIALVSQSKLDEGISYYRKGIALNPKFAEAYNNLGIAMERKGNPDEAFTCYRKAIEMNPNYGNTYFNLGNLLYKQNKPEEAVKYLEEAIKINPQDAGALGCLGLSFARMSMMDPSIAAFRETAKLQPLDPEVRYNLGLALSMKGDLDEAISSFKEAIRLNPNLVDAYNNLGMALAVKGNLDEALVELGKSLQIDPKNPQTQDYVKGVLTLKKENK